MLSPDWFIDPRGGLGLVLILFGVGFGGIVVTVDAVRSATKEIKKTPDQQDEFATPTAEEYAASWGNSSEPETEVEMPREAGGVEPATLPVSPIIADLGSVRKNDGGESEIVRQEVARIEGAFGRARVRMVDAFVETIDGMRFNITLPDGKEGKPDLGKMKQPPTAIPTGPPPEEDES